MGAKLRHHRDAPLGVAVFRQIYILHIGVFHQGAFAVQQYRVLGLLQAAGGIGAAALGKDGVGQQALPEQQQAFAVAQLLLYPLPGHAGGGNVEADRLVPHIFFRPGAGGITGHRGGRRRGRRIYLGHLPGLQVPGTGTERKADQKKGQNDFFDSHLCGHLRKKVFHLFFYYTP